MSILSKAIVPGVKASGKSKGDVAKFLKVFAILHAAQTRVTYHGMGIVAHACGMLNGAHELGRPSSFRCIGLLPLDQQYLVCTKKGEYSDSAIEKWGHVAPAGFQALALLGDEHIEALILEVEAAK